MKTNDILEEPIMQFQVDVRIHDRAAGMPYLADHLAYLNAHFEAGDFLMFGAYAGGAGGSLIAQAPTREALDAVLDADPLKAGRCAVWSVEEFKVGRINVKALEPKA